MYKKNIFKEKSQEDDFLKKIALFGNDTMTVESYYIKPGQEFPMHRHANGTQAIFIIRGEGEFYIMESKDQPRQSFHIKDGDILFIPPGLWHGATNIGETVLIVGQVTSANAGMETTT